MARSIAMLALLVRDYDEAIAFFTDALRFTLVEDTPLSAEKRWVVVAPPDGHGASLLLARAGDAEQLAHVGNQTGGRVFLFLHTNDFWQDYRHMQAHGVRFAEAPREEPYGRVVVFFDLYGNRWDLVEPAKQPNTAADPFPYSDFDDWAADYDQDVIRDADRDGFPFAGYRRALAEVVRLADARPGMSVLDVGAGTGNLSAPFAELGCEMWGLDFSEPMLEQARVKVPTARFVRHDLRAPFPPALDRRFDRIVSGYTFHHFELPEKVALIRRLMANHLAPDGRLVIADISFQSQAAQDAYRETAGDLWGDEPFWIAEDALAALEAEGRRVQYDQVSACAGVYLII